MQPQYKKKENKLVIPLRNQFHQDKPIPQAADLEQAVLGAIILQKDAIYEVAHFLKPEHFYNDTHKLVYAAALDIISQSKPIDLLTLKHKLQTEGKLEIIGGAYTLADLISKVSQSANIEEHARILLQFYIRRQIIEIGTRHVTLAFEDTADAFELKEGVEHDIFKLSEIAETNLASPILKHHDALIEMYYKSASKQISFAGVPSGFTNIDRVTAGFRNSELIILAARPGMGKSALMTTITRNIAIEFNLPVAVFSLEMATLQLLNRMYAAEAEVEADKIFQNKLEMVDYKHLAASTVNLKNAPIYFDDTPGLSVMSFRSKLRKLIMMFGIKIAFVDYLQLMTPDASVNFSNREQEVSYISRSLKAIAKEFNIPIVAIASLSRAAETRGNKRPLLSDLRESGGIESDADMVIFLYRDEYYNILVDANGNSTQGVAEIIIAKNRNGKVDSDIKLKFIGKFQKFKDLENSYSGYTPLPLPPQNNFSIGTDDANDYPNW